MDTIIGGIRVALTLGAFSYASWSDIKTREVSDLVWIVAGVSGLALNIYEYLIGNLPLIQLGLSLAVAIIFGILTLFMGFGQADVLAILCIALLNPYPQLFTPFLTAPVIFTWGFVSNSIVLGTLSGIGVLTLNLTSVKTIPNSLQWWKRALILYTARSIPLEKIRGPPFHYPLEDVSPDGLRKFNLWPNLSDDAEAKAALDRLRISGSKEVWVSWTLPFILVMSLGYIVTLFFGDLLLSLIIFLTSL